MSAAAAAAAIAARKAAKAEAERKAAKREAEKRKYLELYEKLQGGKLSFSQAVDLLRARRAAEDAKALKRRPTVAVLEDFTPGFLRPPEVVGRSGKVYNDTSLFCLRPYHQPRRAAWWCHRRSRASRTTSSHRAASFAAAFPRRTRRHAPVRTPG